MQPDGTLKPERRQSSDYIVASASYSKKGKQQSEGSGKKNDLIVAEDEEKDDAIFLWDSQITDLKRTLGM